GAGVGRVRRRTSPRFLARPAPQTVTGVPAGRNRARHSAPEWISARFLPQLGESAVVYTKVHQAHVSSVRAALGSRSRVAGTRAALRALTLRPWRGRERLTTSAVLRPRVYVPSG